MVCLDPMLQTIGRVWVVNEIGESLSTDKCIQFQIPGNLSDNCWEQLLATDGIQLKSVVDCEATIAKDKELILAQIQQKVGVSAFDQALKCGVIPPLQNMALIEAVRADRVTAVAQLLNHKADPNSSTAYQNTALMLAARAGSVEGVTLLLASGSASNVANNHGDTALLLAARMGHTVIISKLINAKADQALCNKDGFNALQIAAQARSHETICALHGANCSASGMEALLSSDGQPDSYLLRLAERHSFNFDETPWMALQKLRIMWRTFDADGSDALSHEDFRIFWSHYLANQPPEYKFPNLPSSEVIAACDLDGDGDVSGEAFMGWYLEVWKDLVLLKKADSDDVMQTIVEQASSNPSVLTLSLAAEHNCDWLEIHMLQKMFSTCYPSSSGTCNLQTCCAKLFRLETVPTDFGIQLAKSFDEANCGESSESIDFYDFVAWYFCLKQNLEECFREFDDSQSSDDNLWDCAS